MTRPADPRPGVDMIELRRRAEQLAGLLPPPDATDSDVLRQWHELQVSQIELDMQNAALAELQAQKDAAEAGRDRYAQLYDQAPASYLSVDAQGRITRANQAAAMLLERRREDLLGRTFEQYMAPHEQARLRRFLQQLFASGERGVIEAALFGSERQVRVEANLDALGPTCRMIVTDMGDPASREDARRRAFLVLDSIEEGVLVCTPDHLIAAVNPAFTRLTGYLAEEALGRDPAFLGNQRLHPPGYHAEAMRRLLQEGRWQGEVYNRKRDGTPHVVWMSQTVVRDEEGAVSHLIGVFSDITERKRAEAELHALSRELDMRVVERTDELSAANTQLQLEVAERKRAETALHQSREQLRQLAEHLQNVKEEERKHIAREIHDELGQNLLALRIDVSLLAQRSAARHPRLHQRVNDVLANVDASIRSVRGIMNELRPAVLDLGLQAAMEWQVAEFRKRSGLDCLLVLPDDAVFRAIPTEVEIVLFRSLQEALTNIVRHAQASHVEVRLGVDGWRVRLTVADNGIGIAPPQRAKGGSFGLLGIGERAAALGGVFDVARYMPGQGCTLTLSFALPPQAQC
jgi:PAS domain S-box-containing protein